MYLIDIYLTDFRRILSNEKYQKIIITNESHHICGLGLAADWPSIWQQRNGNTTWSCAQISLPPHSAIADVLPISSRYYSTSVSISRCPITSITMTPFEPYCNPPPRLQLYKSMTQNLSYMPTTCMPASTASLISSCRAFNISTYTLDDAEDFTLNIQVNRRGQQLVHRLADAVTWRSESYR
jgi:hypothetical protein